MMGEVTAVQIPQNCLEKKQKNYQCSEIVATTVLDALVNTLGSPQTYLF